MIGGVELMEMKGATMSDKKCPNCSYEIDSWNDCTSVNNILECPECEEHFELKAIPLNQPQLTIPKSIVDKLDDIFNGFIIGMQIEELLPDENQVNIAIAYLAGKALGVDLVKVVEG